MSAGRPLLAFLGSLAFHGGGGLLVVSVLARPASLPPLVVDLTQVVDEVREDGAPGPGIAVAPPGPKAAGATAPAAGRDTRRAREPESAVAAPARPRERLEASPAHRVALMRPAPDAVSPPPATAPPPALAPEAPAPPPAAVPARKPPAPAPIPEKPRAVLSPPLPAPTVEHLMESATRAVEPTPAAPADPMFGANPQRSVREPRGGSAAVAPGLGLGSGAGPDASGATGAASAGPGGGVSPGGASGGGSFGSAPGRGGRGDRSLAGDGRLARAIPGSGEQGGGSGGDYAPYLARLRHRIQEALRYPLPARRRGVTGAVHVELLIEPSGRVLSASVVESSSHRLLDEAALEAVLSVEPVPFPAGLERRALRLRLPVVFELR